jgi:hypothetical protein
VPRNEASPGLLRSTPPGWRAKRSSSRPPGPCGRPLSRSSLRALFHPVDLSLDVVAVFRAHAGHVPAAAQSHAHRVVGARMVPERDLCVAGGDGANQADDGHGTSHQTAQVGAGKHVDFQCPVAGDESGVGFMVRRQPGMAYSNRVTGVTDCFVILPTLMRLPPASGTGALPHMLTPCHAWGRLRRCATRCVVFVA